MQDAKMLLRVFLLIAIFGYQNLAATIKSGKFWNRYQQEFVEFRTIPELSALYNEPFIFEDDWVTYNLMGEIVKVTYHEEKNIVEFYDNDTKVSGVNGEIWNLLSSYLNFTLFPVKSPDHNYGTKLKNNSFTGLMGIIFRKEAEVILRAGLYVFRREAVDYTTPFWLCSFQFYIQPEYKYDNTWVFTLLAPETWGMVLLLFFAFSAFGYTLQKIVEHNITVAEAADRFSINDHLFYNFGIMCSQGYVPSNFHDKLKVVSISKSLTAWMILLVFSSHLMYRMANRSMEPPFTDIETLLNSTQYVIVAFTGSMVYESFQKLVAGPNRVNKDIDVDKRVRFTDTLGEMYHKVCYGGKTYAMFEVDDRYMASNKFNCRVIPVGRSYYRSWVGSAMAKSFKYKRVINTSIIKLHETGLMDGLRRRWLDVKGDTSKSSVFFAIDLNQVYLIFMILCIGVSVSAFSSQF